MSDFRIDTKRFAADVNTIIEHTDRTGAQILNQSMADIATGVLTTLGTASTRTKQASIRAYINRQVSQRIRPTKSKNAKRPFVKKGRKADQLQLVHLIVQARRAHHGRKGLYGLSMRKYAAHFRRRSIQGASFLGAPLVPIARALNRVVKIKVPFALTRPIPRWPGSAGEGIAKIAKKNSLEALATYLLTGKRGGGWTLGRLSSRGGAQANRIINSAFKRAFDEKLVHIKRQAERALQETYRKAGVES